MPIKINKEKLAAYIDAPVFERRFCNNYRKTKKEYCPHLNGSWEECDLFGQFLYKILDKNTRYKRFLRCKQCKESVEEILPERSR